MTSPSVWQELDEFVITRELDQHLRKFIAWYLDAMDQGSTPDATGKMGIWISGFFGSGKSHFLKVLSYLLQNRIHTTNGQSKRAVEFFESKVKGRPALGRHEARGRCRHRCHPLQYRQQGPPTGAEPDAISSSGCS